MKNVVNLTVKFTIDHYLTRESLFKNEKYCVPRSQQRRTLFEWQGAWGFRRYHLHKRRKFFKWFSSTVKLFRRREKTKLSSAQLAFIQNSTCTLWKLNLHFTFTEVPHEISKSERRLHCRNLFFSSQWKRVYCRTLPDLTFPVTEWDLGTRLALSLSR